MVSDVSGILIHATISFVTPHSQPLRKSLVCLTVTPSSVILGFLYHLVRFDTRHIVVAFGLELFVVAVINLLIQDQLAEIAASCSGSPAALVRGCS